MQLQMTIKPSTLNATGQNIGKMQVYRGTLVHCLQPHTTQILKDHVIGFDEETGEIIFIDEASRTENLAVKHIFGLDAVISLTENQFLVPGFVDTHIHPQQYLCTGTGYDKQLLDWLKHYISPIESTFGDTEMAKDIFSKAVHRSVLHGTTTACYLPTIHLESTKELCRIVERAGHRALIGKSNYDGETVQEEVDCTKKFIKFTQEMNNPLIQPILLPSSLFSCSPELMKSISLIAAEHNLPVHSHICEQQDAVKRSLQRHPGHSNCATAFDKYGLLTDKTFMAHCVYLDDSELQLFKERGVGIAHCPNSNLCLQSGLMDAKKVLDMDLKIGLGTDMGGGYSSSILDAMRKAIDVAKALSFSKQEGYQSITHHEALYMATLGGAKVLSLNDKIGNFEVGKEFDALLIDVSPPGAPFDIFQSDSFDDILMKFIYLGDDRNIVKRFVAGKQLSV